ncbi:MAG TPA: DUF1439 domain-containing protein [Methylophilaceae bacterium]|jgi:hypothetical protein
MQRIVRSTTLALLMLLVAACSGSSRTLSISEAELQQHISQELSIPITVLRIFDVHLGNPVIRLDQESGRMFAKIDTKIRNPMSAQALDGSISLSGRLGFDEGSSTVMLYDSRIENLDIQSMVTDDRYSELFNLLVTRLGSQLFSSIPLYTFKLDELKIGNRRYVPDRFQIVGSELRVTLRPQ